VAENKFYTSPGIEKRRGGGRKKNEIKTQVKGEIHIPPVEMYISANCNREGAFYLFSLESTGELCINILRRRKGVRTPSGTV